MVSTLSARDLGQLLYLLDNDMVNKNSLESLCTRLHQNFHKQKLVAITFLYDMYKSDHVSLNPFAPVFIHLLNTVDNYEGKDFIKKTAAIISNGDPITVPQVDLTGVQLILAERQSQLPHTARSAVSGIIPDPRAPPENTDLVMLQRKTIEGLLIGPDPLATKTVKPEFLRIPPPLYLRENEMIWQDPVDVSYITYEYDPSMLETDEISNEAKKLTLRACKTSLSLSEQQKLLSELEKEPSIVSSLGLTPAKLPDLVEYNPMIAIEILLKLMQGSAQITEYFSVLVNKEVSLHSMEVVNRLTTAVELPTEFVHLYISNCITTCETMKAFCIEFSRIREAAALFRLLRQLDSGELEQPGVSAATAIGNMNVTINKQSNNLK